MPQIKLFVKEEPTKDACYVLGTRVSENVLMVLSYVNEIEDVNAYVDSLSFFYSLLTRITYITRVFRKYSETPTLEHRKYSNTNRKYSNTNRKYSNTNTGTQTDYQVDWRFWV